MYTYKAIIKKVVDGDTVELDVDFGMSIWHYNLRFRLYGIDTPEVFGIKIGTPEWSLGKIASDFTRSQLTPGTEVIIETIMDKQEKYGRYLAKVYVQCGSVIVNGLENIRQIGAYYCINDILVAKGYAKTYLI